MSAASSAGSRYTCYGRPTLDPTVDTIDINILAANFSKTGKTWSDADFDNNNTVDTVDFNLRAAQFLTSREGLHMRGDDDSSVISVLMPKPKRRLKVLFIGNSFTARNDLPGMIARLAEPRGYHFEHQLISVGGASLRTHWNKGEAQKIIASGGWDFVVLQEQSTLPIKNAARMHENVRLFDQVIRPAGAKTALYLTWARQHQPEMQRAITDAYTSIGREIGATIIPVGVAWEKLLAKYEVPVLHDKDKSHPSLAGTYLAASVFFAVLFGQSPVGLPDERGISRAEAGRLQRVASTALNS